MAGTMSAQELSTLNEMAPAQELGKLRKITTMQDIPLAETDAKNDVSKTVGENEMNSQEALDAEAERKLKTGSLKRFFRLSPKKKANDEAFDDMHVNHGGQVIEPGKKVKNNQNTSPKTADAEKNEEKTADPKEKRRFKLRLGNTTEASGNFDLRGSKELSGSFSKSTLKSSLSTYWNSVFKLKKSKRTLKVPPELTSDDEESATNENPIVHDLISGDNDNLAEDVHALKISDDCNTPK